MFYKTNDNGDVTQIVYISYEQANDDIKKEYLWSDEPVSFPVHIPTLEEAQTDKINELKSVRDKAEQLPVTTDKGTFDVDDKALMRINGAIMALGENTIEWTLADNTVVEVSSSDLQNVIVALSVQSNAVHEKYRALKEQVMACTDVDSVEKIVW